MIEIYKGTEIIQKKIKTCEKALKHEGPSVEILAVSL